MLDWGADAEKGIMGHRCRQDQRFNPSGMPLPAAQRATPPVMRCYEPTGRHALYSALIRYRFGIDMAQEGRRA